MMGLDTPTAWPDAGAAASARSRIASAADYGADGAAATDDARTAIRHVGLVTAVLERERSDAPVDRRLGAAVSEDAGRQSVNDQMQIPDVPEALRWLSPMTTETAAGIVLANRAQARHIGGLDAVAEEYERRVVGFFDQALLGR